MQPALSDARVSSRPLHVLAKPTGAICNLDCHYCFYLEKESLYPHGRFRMGDDVLEAYIKQLVESHVYGPVVVAWQGGEPTLMPVAFFRKAMGLVEKYRRPGLTFEHTLQTNGTLLDDEWCEFLREHHFLVGISLDGPRQMHDRYRVDKRGQGTFDAVMAGVRALQKHGVDFNVLTTVNGANADSPREVYHFLRDEVGARWLQFIPIVERAGIGLVQLGRTPQQVSPHSVRPAQWGEFLSTIFDEWIAADVGDVFISMFESALANWLGLPSSGMCVFDETCGHGLALEHNGDLYACDHFVDEEHRLGNITERSLAAAAADPRQLAFGLDKRDSLPRVCRACDVRFACHGECPKNRFAVSADGERGLNYLCAGYRAFFRHIDLPMRAMAELVRRGLPAADVMSQTLSRNKPCPCGSGQRYKRCHGRAPAPGKAA